MGTYFNPGNLAFRRKKIPLADIPSRIAAVIKDEVLAIAPQMLKDKSLEDCLIHFVEIPVSKPIRLIVGDRVTVNVDTLSE